MDLFKADRFLHCLFHQINIFLRNPGVGDEEQVCIDIGVFGKFITDIFYQNFIQRTPVFLSHAHAPVVVVHLDAGL